MKKKMYEKPSVEVVKLQTSVAMLTGSGEVQEVEKENYGNGGEQTWGE